MAPGSRSLPRLEPWAKILPKSAFRSGKLERSLRSTNLRISGFHRHEYACYNLNLEGKTNFLYLYNLQDKKLLSFLVDSGSDLCLLKANAVSGCPPTEERCILKGIGGSDQITLGKVQRSFKISNLSLSHIFHVVDNNFPISCDGLIGRDFLTKFKCKVDFESWVLTLSLNGEYFDLPIQAKMASAESFVVEPGTARVHPINLELAQDSLIHPSELAPGVFLVSSVVPCAGYKHVKIVNTTENPVTLNKFQVKYEPLDNFSQVNTSPENITVRRRQHVLKGILMKKLKNAPPSYRDAVLALCLKYHKVFHLPGDKLEYNNFYEQDIELLDTTPVYRKNYRLPEANKADVIAHVEELIRNEIVEPSISNYNNPIFVVPKKGENGEKQTRLVVDMRALNTKIKGDSFPLPRIDEIYDQLGRAKWFSSLDISSAFHQIKVKSLLGTF